MGKRRIYCYPDNHSSTSSPRRRGSRQQTRKDLTSHPVAQGIKGLAAKGLLCIVCLLLFPEPSLAQQLYAGLIRTKGYVVGSPLSASGLYRFDGDTSWVHVGWNHPRISAIAVDPGNADVLYLAAGNGVLGTRDGGQSWRIMTDWEVTESQDIAVDPNAPEQVYVATAYGIWRSQDAGDSWTGPDETWLPDRKYTQALEIDRTHAGRVFAGTWNGLYVSEDAGRSWSQVGPADVPVLDLEQSPVAPDVWLAGTQGQGVYRSTDGGRTWGRAGGGIAEQVIYSVSLDSHEPDRMAATGWDAAVYVSTDGGVMWTRKSTGLPTANMYRVVFDAAQPGRLWAATVEEGIFRSDDMGESWHYAGMDGTLVFDMVFINAGQP